MHFLSRAEAGREDAILRSYLDVGLTDSGLLVAQQRIAKPPLLVAQMTEEWLNHYRQRENNLLYCLATILFYTIHNRKLAQSSVAPYARGCGSAQTGAASGACSINVACGGGPVVVTGMGSQSPSQPPRRRRMVRGSSPSIQQVNHGTDITGCFIWLQT